MTATYAHFCLKSYCTTGTCASTPPARMSRASSTLLRLVLAYAILAAVLTLDPQYSSACCCVKMPCPAHSCSVGASNEAYAASAPTSCTASWSLSSPMALSTIMMGISSAKVLWRRYSLPCLTMMFVLLLRSCVLEVTLAPTSPLLSMSMMMRFLLSCSWIRITFSVPFTTKYPPGSKGHSPSRASSSSLLPLRMHLLDRSISGMRPITMPPTPFLLVLVTISFPRVYSTSTVTGAAYVMSRSRHCCGVMSSTM
mmetsp:Transcript_38168/g.94672  ORF Transcript_38168/g.94672 Transcript_38168/m.94672 type:complete len:254 (+) Transcript_38168:2122-2883(+)